MTCRYYLSKFVGDGTPTSSFRAKVSNYGPKWGMLDLRPDATRVEGWCFASLDSDSDSYKLVEQDPDIIPLGMEIHAELTDTLIGQLSAIVGVSLIHRKLVDVITEVLFRQGRLRPAPDGKYHIHLGSLVYELSADEATAFIGKLLVAGRPKEPTRSKRDRARQLSGLVKASLDGIKQVVNKGVPDWLEGELSGLGEQQSSHPLVNNYRECLVALQAGEDALWGSHACNWMLMLSNDISIVERAVDIGLLSSRLRTLHDCEPTQYELYVMAGFIEAGAHVEKTDYGRVGEFRVSWNSNWVYVECKRKSAMSVRDRQVGELYRRGTEELHSLMRQHNCYIHVRISCRTDPNDNDLGSITTVVGQALRDGVVCERDYKMGKLEITVGPIPIERDPSRYDALGIMTPSGYEYAVSEGRVARIEDGKPVLENVWSVAWRSQLGSDWLKSALESFRSAASQLPKEDPGLVYLEVPEGTENVVFGRIALLCPAIEQELRSRRRVNAVVLTARCLVTDEVDSSVAITRIVYKTILNKDPRTPLPEGFRILGLHVKRRPR